MLSVTSHHLIYGHNVIAMMIDFRELNSPVYDRERSKTLEKIQRHIDKLFTWQSFLYPFRLTTLKRLQSNLGAP